jgi:hypothetical protein
MAGECISLRALSLMTRDLWDRDYGKGGEVLAGGPFGARWLPCKGLDHSAFVL